MKNLVGALISTCARKGLNVSEALAKFIFKFMALNEDFSFDDMLLGSKEIDSIICRAIDMLQDPNITGIRTVKLQVAFDEVYAGHTNEETQKKFFEAQYSEHVNSIISTNLEYGNEFEIINKTYKKLIDFLIFSTHSSFFLNTKVADQVDRTLQREVASSLESILP